MQANFQTLWGKETWKGEAQPWFQQNIYDLGF